MINVLVLMLNKETPQSNLNNKNPNKPRNLVSRVNTSYDPCFRKRGKQ